MLTSSLQSLAMRHLWLHFTPMGEGQLPDLPIIVRGDGCYVYDEDGKRYLDGLSCLFCVNIGYGRRELAQAAAAQMEELSFYSNWSAAHPRAVELAARVAGFGPGDLNRVFFAASGGDAVDSAVKLARQYHKLTGNPLKTKVIARREAYHGTALSTLALTGITAIKTPFEPLMPGTSHVPNTKTYRLPDGADPLELAEAVREQIIYEGPSTVAAVIMEPVQNSGGCLPPPDGYFQRVREICDQFNVLLISDEVICAWGRIGYFFGCERYGYEPDLVTMAKGLTSAYQPIGAVVASDHVFEPFSTGRNQFLHGMTFGGHPVATAVALANIDIMEQEELPQRVLRYEGELRSRLESLYDLPIVGDVRGAGYLQALELVRDKETKEPFSRRDTAALRTTLSRELMEAGLICRVDDRGGTSVEIAPPLIAGREEFDEIVSILRPALSAAAERMGVG
jgi:adenosylmethionine-8-amino-7-oxononanoate aminotransferase